ncbi:DUF2975 domain-containing protein [Paractinoplanes rishiriensis]|uniref:Transporter n=1 Tax=Paractinoplanes rishiriensis TaxID=1050105 RepID=A0A919K268_9ACTN|nr:DUF2975 domain-containing protein [Actinoplanes rishiriensis]GIE97512.1 transporter [Actinoplanes rishiriensis]
MKRLVVLALRAVLVTGLVGSLFVQTVMVALFGADLDDFGPELLARRVPILSIIVLGIMTVQVTMICVWRLLTMVGRDTVFSHGAFRYVDVVIGAMAAAAVLAFAMAVTLAPGESVAPGIVLLICGASVLIGGVGLLVFVLRMLLAQAVARDAEASHLRAELDEVI